MSSGRSGGLEAMYILAALFMFVAAVAVAALMFVPSGWVNDDVTNDAYRPGSSSRFQPMVAATARLKPGLVQVYTGRYELILHAYNWDFVPAEVRIPRGSEVTIRAWSLQDFHGVAITGTDIILSLEGNKEATATHTFVEPGEYLLVCSEFCGADHVGMQGKLIVD